MTCCPSDANGAVAEVNGAAPCQRDDPLANGTYEAVQDYYGKVTAHVTAWNKLLIA